MASESENQFEVWNEREKRRQSFITSVEKEELK
jgi:hypothetical protein